MNRTASFDRCRLVLKRVIAVNQFLFIGFVATACSFTQSPSPLRADNFAAIQEQPSLESESKERDSRLSGLEIASRQLGSAIRSLKTTDARRRSRFDAEFTLQMLLPEHLVAKDVQTLSEASIALSEGKFVRNLPDLIISESVTMAGEPATNFDALFVNLASCLSNFKTEQKRLFEEKAQALDKDNRDKFALELAKTLNSFIQGFDSRLLFSLRITEENLRSTDQSLFSSQVKIEQSAAQALSNHILTYFADALTSARTAEPEPDDANAILQNYGALSALVPSDDWMYENFIDLIQRADLKAGHPPAMHAAFQRVFRIHLAKPRSQPRMTVQLINNAQGSMSWNLSRIATTGSADFVSVSFIDELFAAIEELVSDVNRGNIAFKTFVEILDQRWLVNNRLRLVMSEVLKRNRDAAFYNPRHALAQLAISRALFENGKDPLLFKGSHSHDSLTAELNRLTKINGIEVPEALKEKASAYAVGFARVELLRYFINTQSKNGFIDSKAHVAALEYQQLKYWLLFTLWQRFEDRLLAAKIRLQEDLVEPFVNARVGNGTMISMNELQLEVGRPIKTLEMLFDGRREIGAGIYVSDQDVHLVAQSLVFHPLALIYAPGRAIKMRADQIEMPWIDVSGDVRDIRLNSPVGAMPIVNGGTVVSPGRAPAKPEKAASGASGGRILITSKSFGRYDALVVANGADGANGYEGGNSPLCNSNYISFTYTWTREYDRKSCDTWGCWWEHQVEHHAASLDVNAGPGGDGGNAGAGGHITLAVSEPLVSGSSIIFYPGNSGRPGIGGECKPPSTARVDGAAGAPAGPGSVEYN